MTQIIKGSKVYSSADGTVSTTFGGLQPPSMDEINTLQKQLTMAQTALINARDSLAHIQADRHNCKRTIGWDNSCLTANTAAETQADANINNYQATIDDISKNKLPAAQSRYEQANKLYQASLAAQASTNPDIIKAAAGLQSQLSTSANKKIWIVAISVAIVVLAVGFIIWLDYRKKKGGAK